MADTRVPEDGISGSGRRVLYVAGSGRSGTSALSGALQTLGMHVPQPEVPADISNPKGFAESQWVVDLHTRLLRRSNVTVSDARPRAWFEAGKLATNEKIREEVFTWLRSQFGEGREELLIKDPRLTWFAGLWQSATVRAQAESAYVIMLRSPMEVVASKSTYYPGSATDLSRTAGWLNLMLHTERSTRGSERALVRYQDLLDDWTLPVYNLGERLGLTSVTRATTKDIRRVHAFIDPELHRVLNDEVHLEVPKHLRSLVEETWRQLNILAGPDGETADTHAAFDELRADYTALYEEAEAIAQSTVSASRKRALADRASVAEAEHPPASPRRRFTLSRRRG